jgi:plastocyanin
MNGETFPESHFGSSDPGSGDITQQGYAAKQVNDMETPDEENGRVSGRGLASVGGNPNSGSETPIITTQAGTQDVSESTVMRKGVQEVSIIASDLGYFPKTVFVSRDVPVRMYVTSSSKNTLCIMMDSFQVRRQVKVQKIEEITFIPNMPGKYRFYCPVNGMEGSLVVRELSSSFAQEDVAPVQPLVRYQGAPRAEERPRDPNAPIQHNTQNYQTTVSSRVPAGGRAVPSYQADWNPNNSAIDPAQR